MLRERERGRERKRERDSESERKRKRERERKRWYREKREKGEVNIVNQPTTGQQDRSFMC